MGHPENGVHLCQEQKKSADAAVKTNMIPVVSRSWQCAARAASSQPDVIQLPIVDTLHCP